jgi:hypothetical protein
MREHWEPVRHLATCRYCGERGLAWTFSKRKEVWYLCEGRQTPGGYFECCPQLFHDCPKRPHSRDHAPPPRQPQPRMPDAATIDAIGLIVDTGYRVAALKAHPDKGGSTRVMQSLNEAAEFLRRLVAALKGEASAA